MQAQLTEPGGTIVPTLRYRDVPAAIDWLCTAFGFEKHHVVSGEDGAVRYAELTFGTGMIMLGPVEDSAFDRLMTQPADTGGAETQICYLFVADADAHCAQARAAGAEIILDIEDEAGSGRGYSCRDPEGHVWNFGTYDPWKRSAHAAQPSRSPDGLWRGVRRLAFAAALVVAVILSAVVVGRALGIPASHGELDPVAPAVASVDAGALTERHQLTRERDRREAVERAIKEVKEQLAQERAAKAAAERAAKEAREQLTRAGTERALEEVRERSALEAAQRIAEEARERLALAERSAETVHEQLAAERSARAAAERISQQAREQLAKEHGAKEAAERVAKEAAERVAKETREEEARERAAAARRPPPRRPVQYGPPSKGKPWINWDP